MEFRKHSKETLPFSMLSEDKQRAELDRTESFAERLVEKIVQIIAAGGRDSITANIKSVSHADKGIKVQLDVPRWTEDAWMMLGRGEQVQITAADASNLHGERQPGSAHISRDQKELLPDDQPVFDQTTAGKKTGGKRKAAKPRTDSTDKVDLAPPAHEPEDPKPDAPQPEPPAMRKKQIEELAGLVVKFMEFEEQDFDQAIEQACGVNDVAPTETDRRLIEQKVRELAPGLFDDGGGDDDLGDDLG